ncbi:MAG: UPF0262 family protein [Azospirillaceae bacterium]
MTETPPTDRIVEITLDEGSVARRSPEVEHERRVAIYDLLEDNRFRPAAGPDGPYKVHLSIEDNRMILDIRTEDGTAADRVTLPLMPFRKVVKDYFHVCESYFEAIKSGAPSRIEAIDMGRRGLHNEGSELLRERLAGTIDIDFDTARRLFTLLCVLHIR